MIFAGEGHKTFLGCLVCAKDDPDSVLNSHGPHGSLYTFDSIFNSYGPYGSSYSRFSPCNPKATDPPILLDPEGYFHGRLTINRHDSEAARNDIVAWLEQAACKGKRAK